MKYLEGLNDAQREAVLHSGGALLILAGAGSGKTRVITVKIAHLIAQGSVDPRSILAVTFTNKAAAEMKSRACLLEPRATDAMIKTFHSFGAWLLRRNGRRIGLSSTFTIYDDDDSITLLRSIYPHYNRSHLSRFSHLISRAKDYGLRPDDDLSQISADPEFVEMYRSYQSRLTEIGNVDFGDLILRSRELLETDHDVANRLRGRFSVILVDEYQDSNVAQYQLLQALCGPNTYVCVVGDDDQSIYRFRGAEVRNILTFADSFPNTTTIRLEENYRSTEPILKLAGSVVERNESRLGKTLWTRRLGGTTPRLALLSGPDEEVNYCVELIRRNPEGETAILYRTNAQSRAFETTFMRIGIPYRIVGTLRFYDREEVKDAIALLKFSANPRDEVAFRRIANKPSRGIGAKSLHLIVAEAIRQGGDLIAGCRSADVGKKARAGLTEFLSALEELLALGGEAALLGSGGDTAGLGEDAPNVAGGADAAHPVTPTSKEAAADLGVVVERALRASGLVEFHQGRDEIAGSQKEANLEELVNAASLYPASGEGLLEFLDAVELDATRQEESVEGNAVTLITMHNTKGLEFDRVIITGLEEGLFPRDGDTDPAEVEEERRLFYVAVTRARSELYLTSCRYRRIRGRLMELSPSRFLSEIPRELMETSGDDGGPWRAAFGPVLGGGDANSTSSPGEDNPYPPGTGVFHDQYGPGIVVQAWYRDADLIVAVQFESGRTAKFLPKYTRLERIAVDD
mgnify:CR=1 FL=1